MDLNVAIVRALEHVGDEAALSAIEYVAERSVWLPSQRYVQCAAKMTVIRMQSRLATQPLRTPAVAAAPSDAVGCRRLAKHRTNLCQK